MALGSLPTNGNLRMGRRLRQQVEGSLPWDPVLALEAMEELFPKVEFLSYEEAREFVGQFKFENVRDWREYRKSYKKTIINIPSHPETIYKNEGWISWPDFLGYKPLLTHTQKTI